MTKNQLLVVLVAIYGSAAACLSELIVGFNPPLLGSPEFFVISLSICSGALGAIQANVP